ncbi:hypothetical protein RRG08_024232 [Elysia crispata]|uniref:Uncharacterized protein n=1 Tax=Elysia crispata TaxID=231223 RepID=A0AAE1D3A0_9GAST|nr:hypothetical protein RRG08_024232 [Elysia crispata]
MVYNIMICLATSATCSLMLRTKSSHGLQYYDLLGHLCDLQLNVKNPCPIDRLLGMVTWLCFASGSLHH